ncbi:MAG: hypothetical protein IJ471_01470 [Eubacterium sp.]|nr:hypothetical protein [Eubacterium sp.]
MKKFELTTDFITVFGIKLFRIRALIEFGDVKEGDLGGFVQKEENLDQYGNAWVSGDARVYGNARVYGDAWVSGNAWVYGNAWVSGDARVYGNARVYGDAWVSGDAHVLWITPIGSRNDTVTFMRSKDSEILVKAGCFTGTIDEFEEKVKETHGENKHAQAYNLAIQLAKLRIDLTESEN